MGSWCKDVQVCQIENGSSIKYVLVNEGQTTVGLCQFVRKKGGFSVQTDGYRFERDSNNRGKYHDCKCRLAALGYVYGAIENDALYS
jgi:hypothetical protein